MTHEIFHKTAVCILSTFTIALVTYLIILIRNNGVRAFEFNQECMIVGHARKNVRVVLETSIMRQSVRSDEMGHYVFFIPCESRTTDNVLLLDRHVMIEKRSGEMDSLRLSSISLPPGRVRQVPPMQLHASPQQNIYEAVVFQLHDAGDDEPNVLVPPLPPRPEEVGLEGNEMALSILEPKSATAGGEEGSKALLLKIFRSFLEPCKKARIFIRDHYRDRKWTSIVTVMSVAQIAIVAAAAIVAWLLSSSVDSTDNLCVVVTAIDVSGNAIESIRGRDEKSTRNSIEVATTALAKGRIGAVVIVMSPMA